MYQENSLRRLHRWTKGPRGKGSGRGGAGGAIVPSSVNLGIEHIVLLPQNLEGPFGSRGRSQANNFLETLRLGPRIAILQRRVSTRPLSRSQSNFKGLSTGQNDFPSIKGLSVASRGPFSIKGPSASQRAPTSIKEDLQSSIGPHISQREAFQPIRGDLNQSAGPSIGKKIFSWSQWPSVVLHKSFVGLRGHLISLW